MLSILCDQNISISQEDKIRRGCLIWFNVLSTLDDYLMPNHAYTIVQTKRQFVRLFLLTLFFFSFQIIAGKTLTFCYI